MLPLENNPDIINMAAVPNLPNSKLLKNICRDFSLTDPFRVIWPLRQDFSYIPRDLNRVNRSRLDFFLVSKSVCSHVKACDIYPTVQSKLFDHKAISLQFGPCTKFPSVPTIASNILNDPDLDIIMSLSALEILGRYRFNYPEQDKAVLLGRLGRCRLLLREAGPDPFTTGAPTDIDTRLRKLAEIRIILDRYPLNDFLESRRTVEDDSFMELYINSVRNDVISYQSYILKLKNQKRKHLEAKLLNLKLDCAVNLLEISEIESELSKLSDSEISNAIKKNPLFAHLNSERITPFFMKMIKGNNNLSSLGSVLDYNGNNFFNDSERKTFIRRHFEKIYEKDPNENDNISGCIEDFLGQDIVNNPIVTSRKLSQDEKDTLDRPLSLEDLDVALQGANSSSAPGIDGINTKFI